MKKLSKIQMDHFNKMSREQLIENLYKEKDEYRIVSYYPPSESADIKQEELKARIDYIESLLKNETQNNR